MSPDSRAAELRRALHRVVDAVLDADDALDRDDADASDRAMIALARNAEAARRLYAALREGGG
jgi:hypothetical protein